METAVSTRKTVSENIFPASFQHTPEIRICQIYSDRISTYFNDPEIVFFDTIFLISIIFMLTAGLFFIILNGVSFVQFFFGIAQKSKVF